MKTSVKFQSEIFIITIKSIFLILFIIGTISVNYVAGQESDLVKNINRYLSLDGKQLIIKYDLPYSDSSQYFDVILNIYYNDKVIQPQDNTLTGSYGKKVAPGVEKVILWDFPNEFTGDINKVTVEVVARKMVNPQANFEFQVLSSKPPYDVKFENKSKNADYYSWNFGDLSSGATNLSTLENPVHKFKSRGKYNIELTAGNSKTRASNSTKKVVALDMGNSSELQKHKTLRSVWLGSAVASAGIGGYCLLKSVSLNDEWREIGTPELEKKYKTFSVIGSAALVISGVCITEVIIQSKKISKIKKSMAINIIPLDKGGAVGLAWKF